MFSHIKSKGKISDNDRYLPNNFYSFFGEGSRPHDPTMPYFCGSELIRSLDQSIESILMRQEQFREFAQDPKLVNICREVISNIKEFRKTRFPPGKVVFHKEGKRYEEDTILRIPDFERLQDYKDQFLKIRNESLSKFREIDLSKNPLPQMLYNLIDGGLGEDVFEKWKGEEQKIQRFQDEADSLILGGAQIDRFTGEIESFSPLSYLDPQIYDEIIKSLKRGEIPKLVIGNREIFFTDLIPLQEATHDFRRRTVKGVQEKLFATPNHPYQELVSKIKEFDRRDSRNLFNEIAYYCKVADFYQQRLQKGLPIDFPEILPAKENRTTIKQFDPVWMRGLEKKILTDIEQVGNQVITGLNSGGKSTYCRNIAMCKLWAQAGLPLPAQEAQVSISTGIGVINSKKDQDGQGIFERELRRVKSMYEDKALGENPLIILEEPFTGTDYESRKEAYKRLVSNYATKGSTLVVSHEGEMLRGLENITPLKIEEGYQTQKGIGKGEGGRIIEKTGF
ncbi:MAG: MutS-related protein [Candidatus Nanoarchaeia archaeon]